MLQVVSFAFIFISGEINMLDEYVVSIYQNAMVLSSDTSTVLCFLHDTRFVGDILGENAAGTLFLFTGLVTVYIMRQNWIPDFTVLAC